jgi:hypothetical protein
VSADVRAFAAKTESLRPLPPLKLSLPVPAMKETGVKLVMALASTVSPPAPPSTRKFPVLVPATRPFVSVTSLPALDRMSCSTPVTPWNCAAASVPVAVTSRLSTKGDAAPPVTVSVDCSVTGVN